MNKDEQFEKIIDLQDKLIQALEDKMFNDKEWQRIVQDYMVKLSKKEDEIEKITQANGLLSDEINEQNKVIADMVDRKTYAELVDKYEALKEKINNSKVLTHKVGQKLYCLNGAVIEVRHYLGESETYYVTRKTTDPEGKVRFIERSLAFDTRKEAEKHWDRTSLC